MASTVEVIIKAVDKYSKETGKAQNAFQKLGSQLKLAGTIGKEFAKLGSAVVAGFALAYNVLDRFGEKARDLGFVEAANQVDFMKQSLSDAEASIFKFNIGGREIQEWLGRAAEAMGWLIRLTGVLISDWGTGLLKTVNNVHAAFSELSTVAQIMWIDTQKSLGLMSEQEAQTQKMAAIADTYTSAMKDADNAVLDLANQTNVANFATVGLAKSLEDSAASAKKQAQSVKSLSSAHKNLNQILSQRRAIEDAIRAGDARALADARGGSRGGRVEAGGVGGGRNMAVNVYVGNEPVDARVRTVYANEVVKPAMKGGSSGGKR